jgi:hypothetical protein
VAKLTIVHSHCACCLQLAENNNNLHGLWYIDAQLRLHTLEMPAKCLDTTGGLVTSQPCSMSAAQVFTGLGEWAAGGGFALLHMGVAEQGVQA